jgi:Xaa-Pro aminopeptidase
MNLSDSGRPIGRSIFVAWIAALAASVSAQSPEEFQARREALREAMGDGSALILRGAGGTLDAVDPSDYRQDSNFFYLTGIKEPGGVLVVRKSGGGGRGGRAARGGRGGARGGAAETLFFDRGNAGRSDWDAASLGLEGAGAAAGIGDVRPTDDFQAEFERIVTGNLSTLYMDYQRSRGLHAPLTPDEDIFKKARDRGAQFELRGAAGRIHPLRRVKSAAEIELLRTAIDITNAAHREVMRSAEPGMYEYQLQAILEHVFQVNGAERVGFKSIVGSGPNSCILHWASNTRQTQAGDVVVVDIGAEYGMYTADVTRTIPINGKFSPRQREVYEIVLAANEAAIARVAPGVSMAQINAAANEQLTAGLMRLGLIRSAGELRNYYFHGLSHSLGLAVHDVGGLGTLEAGMVFTIEPGIYIRAEGIGFRIEDDILVTETGHEVLTAGAPKKVEEIEALMAETGMDIARYLIKR